MDEHDLGLEHDLPRLISRRRALGLMLGTAFMAACGGSSSSSPTTTPSASIPEETAGPFPGDGSNGPNVLTESGVVRQDITRSFGEKFGVAEGIPTTLELTLSQGGKPLTGAAVYVWHCDRGGQYSLYDNDENYLRGVQESDADGKVTFKTIFPAAYTGRWPHVHFEIYDRLGGTKLRTSQLAIDEETCTAAYAAPGYEQSAQNMTQLSLDSDMVFSDGYASQLAKASGSAADGYTLSLAVAV